MLFNGLMVYGYSNISTKKETSATPFFFSELQSLSKMCSILQGIKLFSLRVDPYEKGGKNVTSLKVNPFRERDRGELFNMSLKLVLLIIWDYYFLFLHKKIKNKKVSSKCLQSYLVLELPEQP